MPPLVMPWSAKNFSSVRTSTSKIALPIPSTSYFASAIRRSCRGGRRCAPANRRWKGAAAYHVSPCASKRRCYKRGMLRSFLTVASGTLASRLLGFVRDSMVAALLGAGPVADAFLVAFQLVNVVRRLLTEGALNAALVPVWLRLRETEGEAAAGAFAGRVLATVSAVLVALSAAI